MGKPWRAAYDDEYAASSDLRGWDGFFWLLGFAGGVTLAWFLTGRVHVKTKAHEKCRRP